MKNVKFLGALLVSAALPLAAFATELEVTIKKLAEHAQLMQWRGIGGDAPLQACLELINFTQHLLHVQLGVVVLAQANGGF